MPNNRDIKQAIVPDWNEYVKEQHEAARDSYWLWLEMGKPMNGDVFTLMKLCRSRFKYALRKCMRDKETSVYDSIADKMCQTDQRNFWKEIRCRPTMNSKTLRQTFRTYPGIHTNCIISHCTTLQYNHNI